MQRVFGGANKENQHVWKRTASAQLTHTQVKTLQKGQAREQHTPLGEL